MLSNTKGALSPLNFMLVISSLFSRVMPHFPFSGTCSSQFTSTLFRNLCLKQYRLYAFLSKSQYHDLVQVTRGEVASCFLVQRPLLLLPLILSNTELIWARNQMRGFGMPAFRNASMTCASSGVRRYPYMLCGLDFSLYS